MKKTLIKTLFNFSTAVVLGGLCFIGSQANADIITGWDVSTQTATAGPSPLPATVSDTNLTIVGLTRGSGVTVGAVAKGWGGVNWQGTDEGNAISINEFVTFSVTANPGYTMSLTNVSQFSYRRSSTGASTGVLQYQVGDGSFIDIATIPYTSTSSSGATNAPIDLSTISDLQNISAGTTITFRIVNYGGTSTSGTWYVYDKNGTNDDLEILGTVAVVPLSPPVITSIAPTSISTNAGATVAFAVSATGSLASDYWYKVTDTTTNLISTATTPTLTLTNVLAADTASYFVILSNSVNTATSDVVMLTVTDPAITTDLPATQTSFANTALQLSVGAAGTALTYQWFEGTPGSETQLSNGGRFSGTDSGTLTISNLMDSDSGNYFVVVTNGLGNTVGSSVTALTVIDTGVVAKWDFNGTFNLNTPAPAIGSGTASLLNGVAGSSAGGSSPNDTLNASHEGLANNGWSTTGYPAAGSNKTAGVQFNVSTLGLKNVKITYDIRASATASKYMRLQYTTNGTDFIDFPASMSFMDPTYFESEAYDLTGLPGVADNVNFGFRIVSEFESTATYGATNDDIYVGASSGYGTGGAIRFDIVTVNADSITGTGTPPTISSIDDFTTTDESAASNVNFTIGDAETDPSSLTVSAVSENQNALPSGNIIVSGSGADRVLTVTPQLGSTGIAPVLVTVTDGDGNSTTTSFYVTVNPGNYPPTISYIPATNILANSSITLAFTVSDDATAPDNLAVTTSSGNETLLPDANVVLGGSGTDRTITVTPAANKIGVAPVSIQVMDDDAIAPKSSVLTFTVLVRPNTNVLLNDFFDYADGSLVTNSGGFWQTHSGTPGQMQVTSGQNNINDNNSEDVNALLVGQPYTTNSPFFLYSSFTVNFSVLPTESGAYFAHFKDTNSGAATGFGARVWASTLNAADGDFRLGIGNGAAATNTSGQFPMDLVLNSNYTVVTRFIPSNGVATIWINPTGESDTSGVTATDVTNTPPNPINVVSYAFRENDFEGIMTVDSLKVGLTFDSVFPALHIQSAGSNVILDWADPMLGIQSAADVTGPFTDVLGATPPYTFNASTNGMMFFRLGQ